MNHRICRHLTTSTFKVNSFTCKVFLEPLYTYKGHHWIWNVGFVVGRSNRQVNDWFRNRKNKRVRKIKGRLVGTEGMSLISKGFKEVLRLRWCIAPGDLIVLDCTSGDPEKQFKAWTRFIRGKGKRNHPDWVIDEENKKFFWYRPPYPGDLLWVSCVQNGERIIPLEVDDPLMSCLGAFEYLQGFSVLPSHQHTLQSNR